jgi:hypothetical protein
MQSHKLVPVRWLSALRSEIPTDKKTGCWLGIILGMEEMLAFLTHEARHMPTCALARISLDGVTWKEVGR